MTKNRTPTPVYLDPGMHPGLEVKGLNVFCPQVMLKKSDPDHATPYRDQDPDRIKFEKQIKTVQIEAMAPVVKGHGPDLNETDAPSECARITGLRAILYHALRATSDCLSYPDLYQKL